MFHTFNSGQNPSSTSSGTSSSSRRRSNAVHACEQCRRRKIRCDGQRPCEACQWYKKVDLCYYSDPLPSQKHTEKLSATLKEYEGTLKKLFPGTALDSLSSLSRDKLLDIANRGQTRLPNTPAISPPPETHPSQLSPESDDLESLQSIPEAASDNRDSQFQVIVASVTDDVNALSLSSKQPSSYLGISSVHAILKVINHLSPGSIPSDSNTPPQQTHQWDSSFAMGIHPDISPIHSHPNRHQEEERMIHAYFENFHPLTPLLDEITFKEHYHSRVDGRWNALLNMVFALGSIAANTADNMLHEEYFKRAKKFLDLDALGKPHLETVQTLSLMGGHYLHYISQPHLAYCLVGAALRMAATLGIHREFSGNNDSKQNSVAELRRRVWWSLLCMDTWGCETLGRPSLGRWGPGITAKLPQYSKGREQVSSILPLVENIRYCRVVTQVQDMTVTPLINHAEMVNLDNQLLEWYENLPELLKTYEPCLPATAIARTVMRWRYRNQRILLYRPALLSYAMRRIPYIALRSEERAAIEKCRSLAEETIQDISATTNANPMLGWNGVWIIFQATMVPLLGLFITDETNTDLRASRKSCQTLVESAMNTLERMQLWSPTALRSLDCVYRIYDASKRETEPGGAGNSSAMMRGGYHATTINTASSRPQISTIVPPAQLSVNRTTGLQSPVAAPNLMTDPVHYVPDQEMFDFLAYTDDPLGTGFSNTQFVNDNTAALWMQQNTPAFMQHPMDDGSYFMGPASILQNIMQ
ncbi:Fungal specific transcription factor domain containing protein [Elaphomyces granulatus]